MERYGIKVQIITINHLGGKKIYKGRVVHFGPDGRAIVVYTEGPNKGMFNHTQLSNLRAILDDEISD